MPNIYREHTQCPKCGADFITTRYDSAADVIRRRCARCGYGWSEQPLDHARRTMMRKLQTPGLRRSMQSDVWGSARWVDYT